jgi:hypothetical protein
MHELIRENLEDYLRGSAGRVPLELQEHLASCRECAAEVERLALQARMFRSLQASEFADDLQPRAGFYARVMDRIERDRPESIWSVLLEPSFGRRLAMASAALVLAMGAYLVTTELSDPMIAQAPAAMAMNAQAQQVDTRDASTAPDSAADAAQQQRRDALLVNLASFRQ